MYLICNYKDKLTYNEVKEYKEKLNNINIDNVDFIVCPSLPFIYDFARYTLAAQNISSSKDNITGEISGKQLKSLYVEYVLVNHVERRKKLYETIDDAIEKIKNAHKNNIKVIYCFTSYNKDINDSKKQIKNEYEKIKDYIKESDLIAFEPEWAIGDESLDFEYIKEIINYIEELMNKNVIYGGSVNESTIEELLTINNIDGFLVSTIAVDITELQKVIEKIS